MDRWSKREKLFLASAVVSCNGDQNWGSVSRSLKMNCGPSRPSDWFSQKSCAAQYAELLKTYTNANSNLSNNDMAEEVTADSILTCLTKERTQDLTKEISKSQQEYAKMHAELKQFQAGNLSDQEVVEMWREIEKETEMKRIEEMKLENQLREREERKQEQDRAWRPISGIYTQKVQIPQQESDIDGNGCKLSQLQQQGTSPLLSSLLKSPTATSTTSITSTARSTAPTITTLLTGGAIDPNKPVLTLKNTIPPNHANALTRPISGPPLSVNNDSILSLQGQNNLLSPSQSAPTLSMLLEKNKVSQQQLTQNFATRSESPRLPSTESPQSTNEANIKVEIEQQEVADSNNEEVPMDIEEDIIGGTVVVDDGTQSPSKEEEQQLMEVFKNIGNIDELAGILNPAILEEEGFLKDVESLMDEGEEEDEEHTDFEIKSKESEACNEKIATNQVIKPDIDNETACNTKSVEEHSTEEDNQENESFRLNSVEKELKDEQNIALDIEGQKQDENIENISSDDSYDNVPLVALSSQETKALGQSESPALQEESIVIEDDFTKHDDDNNIENKANQIADDNTSNQSENQKDDYEGIVAEMEGTKDGQTSHKSSISDNSDVIIIPTDDESNEEKQHKNQALPHHNTLDTDKTDKNEKNKVNSSGLLLENTESSNTSNLSATKITPTTETPTISIGDTDDDSSTMDTACTGALSNKKDDNRSTQQPTKSTVIPRSSPKKVEVEDENVKTFGNETTQSLLGYATPKQALTIRKLRDRDRSESPMIDDDNSEYSVTLGGRTRRRYSTTPVTDSIPNSPASGDDRESKAWKKSLMNLFNSFLTNRNASIFIRPFTEEEAPQYKLICHRPMDLQIIKRNIESGLIRNVHEFQRDLMLMCLNAIMIFKQNTTYYNMAKELMEECSQLKDQTTTNDPKPEKEKDKPITSSTSGHTVPVGGVKVRGSSRKSQRLPLN